MKARAIFQVEPYRMEVREVDVPDPGPDEVQVKCLANGICMAEVSVHTGVEKRVLPRIPGHEGIGTVVKAGAAVKGMAEGDTVTCGRWAELANYRADYLAGFAARPADPAVMMAEPVECAVRAMTVAEIVPGDRVLVLGAGFMGLLHIQGLTHCPLAELVAVDVKPANLELARAFGAGRAINAGTPDGAKELAGLRAARPFDLVVEAAGVQGTVGEADAYVRRGGRLSIYAWHHGPRTVDMGRWHLGGLRVVNSSPGSGVDSAINFQQRAVRLLENGTFDQRRLVTHRHRFTDVGEAMELAVRRPTEYIKGVLLFDD